MTSFERVLAPKTECFLLSLQLALKTPTASRPRHYPILCVMVHYLCLLRICFLSWMASYHRYQGYLTMGLLKYF